MQWCHDGWVIVLVLLKVSRVTTLLRISYFTLSMIGNSPACETYADDGKGKEVVEAAVKGVCLEIELSDK